MLLYNENAKIKIGEEKMIKYEDLKNDEEIKILIENAER